MKVTGFGIANYRSFHSEGVWVRRLGNINVLIGRNNCGKSNVLRFLRLVAINQKQGRFSLESESDRHKGGNDQTNIGIAFEFDDEIDSGCLEDTFGSATPTFEVWLDIRNGQLIGDNPFGPLPPARLEDLFQVLTDRRHTSVPRKEQVLREVTQALTPALRHQFFEEFKDLIYIPAIREIRMVEGEESDATELSGRNIIRELRMMQHPLVGQERRQKEFLLIQKFVGDLIGVGDLLIEIPADADDIYLNMHGNRLPLSHYGTGIHELVILCSALAIHHNHVVCIEEPEIHLHPALLRKFLRFLHISDNRYFITTHSNVFLDADPTVQVYHVSYDGSHSAVERKETDNHARAILRDLSYRASDLLQTNGIIWVEGPSDRVYINKWMSLAGSEFVEGIHYSIMFYGGSLLANLSITDGPGDDLIELLRINQNAIVVIDRDGASSKSALRSYKKRIQSEIGDNQCWITQGREIENYLRPELLFSFFEKKKPGKVSDFKFEKDDRIQDAIEAAVKVKSTPNYNSDKVGYARHFREMMTADDLEILNLKTWIRRIMSAIQEWNDDG